MQQQKPNATHNIKLQNISTKWCNIIFILNLITISIVTCTLILSYRKDIKIICFFTRGAYSLEIMLCIFFSKLLLVQNNPQLLNAIKDYCSTISLIKDKFMLQNSIDIKSKVEVCSLKRRVCGHRVLQ